MKKPNHKRAYQVRKYMTKAIEPFKKYLTFMPEINDNTDDEWTAYLITLTNTFNKNDRAFVLRSNGDDVEVLMGTEYSELPHIHLLGYLFFNDFIHTF